MTKTVSLETQRVLHDIEKLQKEKDIIDSQIEDLKKESWRLGHRIKMLRGVLRTLTTDEEKLQELEEKP